MTGQLEPDDHVLPGGTLMSRVAIYDSVSVDAQRGGTPHLHLACDEMYYGLAGQGAVELITYEGFARRPVVPGVAICFTPGTIHRAINPDGDLTILVIMQNKGLPERGDVAVCFPRQVLDSPQDYDKAMPVHNAEEARNRRDLGVAGFIEIKQAFDRCLTEGRAALDHFYRIAIERTRHHYPSWSRTVEQGPALLVRRSERILKKLEAGSIESLQQGRYFDAETGPKQTFGFCGQISAYQPAEASRFMPEGVRSQ